MAHYTKEFLRDENPEQLEAAVEAIAPMLERPWGQFNVWRFHEAPGGLRQLCSFNGGDEDWLVLTTAEELSDWMPSWIERMDSCLDPDIYELGLGFVAIVGSHS